jgi:hypothetical protein
MYDIRRCPSDSPKYSRNSSATNLVARCSRVFQSFENGMLEGRVVRWRKNSKKKILKTPASGGEGGCESGWTVTPALKVVDVSMGVAFGRELSQIKPSSTSAGPRISS